MPARPSTATQAQGPGPVGPRLPRAAQPERAQQEGRRPAQRPPADHRHLPAHRLRRHRPGRPARPVPLDGPVHAAPPGHPRRQDGDARAGRARGRVLHAAHPHRRRRADHRAAARRRRHLDRATAATSPTSATGRTSSCTGSASRTSRRSGARLEAVGLSTTEACGDCPRVMLGCPLEGVAADSVLDAGPALRETVEKYLGDPAFSNLPRKYKTSISGCARHCTNHEINDCAFVGVIGPDGDARLRPVGRRRAVDQPALRRAARRLRPARRGQRGVGRRHVDLPRLRLPARSATTPG